MSSAPGVDIIGWVDKSNGDKPLNRDEVLQKVRSALEAAFPDRLRGVVLYGSEARGTARPDSDIDLLVLLDAPVRLARDIDKAVEALYPLSLRLGRHISAMPVDAEEYESVECPLYRAAHREGVTA